MNCLRSRLPVFPHVICVQEVLSSGFKCFKPRTLGNLHDYPTGSPTCSAKGEMIAVSKVAIVRFSGKDDLSLDRALGMIGGINALNTAKRRVTIRVNLHHQKITSYIRRRCTGNRARGLGETKMEDIEILGVNFDELKKECEAAIRVRKKTKRAQGPQT